ncbi:MAG: hypothetical protein J5590_06970 [Clostridia bacterium]|nr:hypothetical protein [Clostridia bacterium]
MLIIKSIRCIFADIMYFLGGADTKALIDADVRRNLKWDKKRDSIKSPLLRFNYLLLTKCEFRSVFYFRVKKRKCLSAFCKALLPCPNTIEFGGEIGGGILVSHYHSVICPHKAGINFRVGPGTVIDKGRDGKAGPSFGNNIYVASNSSVTGDISIGDNVIIGAGSSVSEDLPGNGVYVGNPARFIKHIDDNEKLLNEIM